MTNNVAVNPGHPSSCLYVVMDGDINADRMDAFESWLSHAGSERSWVIQPPELIDYMDEDDSLGGSSHTFGCALRLYSALPPWGEKLPKEVDRQHLEETEFLLSELSNLSRQLGCNFRLQLDRTPIGVISNGEFDEGIKIGLLGEWRKAHGSTT
jgi:hypothetical protein